MTDALTPPAAPAPRPQRKGRWLRVVLTLFIFIAGLLCGAGLTVAIAVHRIRIVLHHPEEVPARITNYLHRRLNLTADQTLRIEALITERQAHLQQIRRRVQPEVQSELDGLREQIAAVLTPEQQPQWNRLYEESIENWLPPLPASPPALSPN